MKANYHCHTARCMHATGMDREYVQQAITAGFDVLGFSDHVPFPFPGGYVSRIRMRMDELEGYLASIRSLRETYGDRIRILTGFECEYFPVYDSHLRRMLEQADYLIQGQHFCEPEGSGISTTRDIMTDDGALYYAEAAVRGIRSGLFRYIAHPDLYMKYRRNDDFSPACEQAADMILQAATEAGMPIEFNLLGQLEGTGYPCDAFWQHARKWKPKVILGVDAHAPWQMSDRENYDRGLRRLADLGYEPLTNLDI